MMAKAFVFMRKKMVKYATDETVEQLAKDYEASMKEAAEVLSKAFKGKHHTKETKKKMSEMKKHENNPMYGKQHSDETKKKISKALKGKPAWNRGKPNSAETLRKMSEVKKGKNNPAFGKHWYNNGKINIRARECPEGFTPGRIK